MQIRAENENDYSAVYAVNTTAFETRAEADLVDALREQCQPNISLVAEEVGLVVGHIMLSPVVLTGHPEVKMMGLAPIAVALDFQCKGVGSALVCAGLEQCKNLGFGAVVVLGHPQYYPRFDFVVASRLGIGCEYDVPEEAFMVAELQPGYLKGVSGIVKYSAAFGNV